MTFLPASGRSSQPLSLRHLAEVTCPTSFIEAIASPVRLEHYLHLIFSVNVVYRTVYLQVNSHKAIPLSDFWFFPSPITFP